MRYTELRALVWAAGRDGPLTCAFLRDAGIDAYCCASQEELQRELTAGAGVLILAIELLTEDVRNDLHDVLERQSAWSDIPVIVVGASADASGDLTQLFDVLGNASFLHRPLSLDTLASTVKAGLRARRRQFQVRDLLRQREEVERRREEFLAMLAHELRNPLAPIRTGLQLLRMVPSHEIMQHTQTMIERQVGNLARLIDDLLDVSRITRGTISLQRQSLHVHDLLRQAVESQAQVAKGKGLTVTLEPGEPLCVDADPIRFEQMIGNVLVNAIKFTPAGGSVRVSATREGDMVVIRVKDSGVGIPPHMLQAIFELFAQTDRPLDRAQGGLGIGLTVVRSLAELHGGSAEAHSDGDNQGAEIIVRLPLAAAATESTQRTGAPCAERTAERRRVLVVEDNREAADTLAAYLGALGHTVSVAYDGSDGVRQALAATPDVLICDIGLPGIDGYELVRLLREEPRFESCLFVAVTGYGEARDRSRGMAAGFQHYLTKPADPVELARVVTQARVQQFAASH